MMTLQQDQLDYSPEYMAAFLAAQELSAMIDAIFGDVGDVYFLGPVESVIQSEVDLYNAWWISEFSANPNYAPEYVVPYVSFEYVEQEPDPVQTMVDSIFDW